MPGTSTLHFSGMSYEDASRKGLELTREAGQRQNWCNYVDALIELREIMRHAASPVIPPPPY